MDAYSAYSSDEDENVQQRKYDGTLELKICNVISIQVGYV
jgi:hypothetical protein